MSREVNMYILSFLRVLLQEELGGQGLGSAGEGTGFLSASALANESPPPFSIYSLRLSSHIQQIFNKAQDFSPKHNL